MKDTKRLFLIAGYEASGKITPAMVHLVREFAKYGDCILTMDSDCVDSETAKIQPFCKYVSALRHGEYDFGSYKRDFIWAKNNLNLIDYDFVYLINDSMYGPFFDMDEYFDKMESFGTDAFGMVRKTGGKFQHIQSWFIGMTPAVFMSKWFDEFINSVTKVKSKTAVTSLYENGFTRLLNKHNIKWQCLYSVFNRGIYNRVKHLYLIKMPFMKKLAWTRHAGSLGRQVLFVLNKLSPALRQDILVSAKITWGEKYIDWFLTKNPAKILVRYSKYILSRKHCKKQK
ncbi:MAG: hypothetical protein J5611_03140 [Alphaproteobacteria bacterium]|nr:hypothetical protein [Alphaproteobacteria bacterium]